MLFLAQPIRFQDTECSMAKKTNIISVVRVFPDGAETLVRRGGITNHRLIAHSLSNISAQKY